MFTLLRQLRQNVSIFLVLSISIACTIVADWIVRMSFTIVSNLVALVAIHFTIQYVLVNVAIYRALLIRLTSVLTRNTRRRVITTIAAILVGIFFGRRMWALVYSPFFYVAIILVVLQIVTSYKVDDTDVSEEVPREAEVLLVEDCCLCLDPMLPGDIARPLHFLECCHKYHLDCVRRVPSHPTWPSIILCPLCRAECRPVR